MKKIHVYQLNGCEKCANEALLLKCPENNGDNHEISWIRLSDGIPDEKADYAVITGYATEDNIDDLKKIRNNANQVIVFGSCASYGGIFGLLNQKSGNVIPVNKAIDVDMSIPGCLASSSDLASYINVAKTPIKGSLCKSCNRQASCEFLSEINRQIDLAEVDEEQCFNDMGYVCNGFIASECSERCIDFGAPCRGCMPMVSDSGFRMLSSMGTLMGQMEVATEACPAGKTDKLADEEDEVSAAFPDVVGTFFRFVLADSMISRGKVPPVDGTLANILVGRPLEEIPSITGMMGGNNFISLTLDIIEEYEKVSGMDVPESVKKLRSELRELEKKYQKAVEEKDPIAYFDAKSAIKAIAGNMNLSNLYYGGFRVLTDNLKQYGDEILAKPIELQEYTSDKFKTNEKGVITELKEGL